MLPRLASLRLWRRAALAALGGLSGLANVAPGLTKLELLDCSLPHAVWPSALRVLLIKLTVSMGSAPVQCCRQPACSPRDGCWRGWSLLAAAFTPACTATDSNQARLFDALLRLCMLHILCRMKPWKLAASQPRSSS